MAVETQPDGAGISASLTTWYRTLVCAPAADGRASNAAVTATNLLSLIALSMLKGSRTVFAGSPLRRLESADGTNGDRHRRSSGGRYGNIPAGDTGNCRVPAVRPHVYPSAMDCRHCPDYTPSICDSAGPRLCGIRGCEVQNSQGRVDVGALFTTYHSRVVAWACRRIGSYDVARDIAQDVFIKVLTGIDSFRASARFSTWLYAVARNCCRDYVKARAARPREVGDAVLQIAPPLVENDALALLEAASASRIVRALFREARLDA